MERPYNGQAILNETLNELEIIIPTKKNWGSIIFLGAWLGGWAIGEFLVIWALIGAMNSGAGFSDFFLIFWFCGWTVGGFFAIKNFIWNLAGKEIITFGKGQLTLAKKGSLLAKPKIYDLNQVKKLRTAEDENFYEGTMKFDYGLQTVRFASGIDEAEANFIFEKLRTKNLITERNL